MEVVAISLCWFAVGFYVGAWYVFRKNQKGGEDE